MLIKDKIRYLTKMNWNGPKELAVKNKSNLLFYFVVAAVLIMGVIAVFNNYKWYDATIVKIDQTEDSLNKESIKSSTGEKHYNQTLLGTVMNGEYQGHQVCLQNKYSSSGVFDEKYKVGDDVFIHINSGSNEMLTGTISGLKRDKYLAAFCAVFIFLILIIATKRGIFSILSLIVNIAIFWYALDLYSSGINILLLSNCMILLFTTVSLLLISGWKKKTFTAIFATLISIFFTMLLFKIVMMFTDGVDYAFMEYIASPNDLPEIFMSQIMLGGLGAVMDVAITEAATINELVEKNNAIPLKKLIKSGREVGHDIMGTMINVMLFTYISGSIPLIILKMNSDIKLHTIILWHMPMELYRFLVGSIGILLTIPISLLVSIVVFKKWRRIA